MSNNYQLDINQLDILTIDGLPSGIITPPSDDIYYYNLGLQNSNIVTESVKVSPAAKAIAERAFPRAQGEYAETVYDRKTLITIKGVITAATQIAMETIMDQMSAAFMFNGGTFKHTQAGIGRYYDNCYAINSGSLFDAREYYHITWTPFTIQLLCMQPYARTLARTVYAFPTPMTVTPTVYLLNNAGNAVTQPILTASIVTAGSLSSLTITNTTTNESITIASTFTDGDVINIDNEKKEVTKNGIAIDYVGVMPSMLAGDNYFSITAVGAGYSIAFTDQHYPRYY